MIHEVGVELGAALKSKEEPLPVIDGPETTKTTTFGRERIVIEYDLTGADSFGPPRGAHVNPRQRATMIEAWKITIYAQSPSAGALEFEHRRRAKRVLRMIMSAMDLVAGTRKNRWSPTRGKFLVPDDLAKSDTQGGAVYELALTYESGVPVLNWAGASNPQKTFGAGGITSTTKVSMAHGPDDDNDDTTVPATAETACGGD